MKSNGSIYVAVVLAVLAGYFAYQWWFNPSRAIKRQLGELAAVLSVPPGGQADIDRLGRAARLRSFFAPDVQITTGPRTPAVTSRDALVAAIAAWNPPDGGWDISFGDVQIALDSDTTARAFLTVTMTTADPATGQPSVDSREARMSMLKLDDVWVIKTAEPGETTAHP